MSRFFCTCENQPCGITKLCVAVQIMIWSKGLGENHRYGQADGRGGPYIMSWSISLFIKPTPKGILNPKQANMHMRSKWCPSLAHLAPPPLSGRPWAGPRVPVGGAAAPWVLRRFSPRGRLVGGSQADQLLPTKETKSTNNRINSGLRESPDILCPPGHPMSIP
jgi:hypothetical protein